MRLCANCARKDTICVSTSAATAVTRRSGSKCTMASVSMSEQANHAKTEWQQGTNWNDQARMTNVEGSPNDEARKKLKCPPAFVIRPSSLIRHLDFLITMTRAPSNKTRGGTSQTEPDRH